MRMNKAGENVPPQSSERRAAVSLRVSNYTCSDRTNVQGVKQNLIQRKIPRLTLIWNNHIDTPVH